MGAGVHLVVCKGSGTAVTAIQVDSRGPDEECVSKLIQSGNLHDTDAYGRER